MSESEQEALLSNVFTSKETSYSTTTFYRRVAETLALEMYVGIDSYSPYELIWRHANVIVDTLSGAYPLIRFELEFSKRLTGTVCTIYEVSSTGFFGSSFKGCFAIVQQSSRIHFLRAVANHVMSEEMARYMGIDVTTEELVQHNLTWSTTPIREEIKVMYRL
jgi:hypothetical protein